MIKATPVQAWTGPEGYSRLRQLVEALSYELEGCGFDSRWMSFEFFIDIILPAALWL
jgi:hypothetical protein